MGRKAGIGKAEMEVLHFIADRQSATVREVADYLAETKGHTRTTALNIMERLREKGHLAREKGEGGVYRYSPSIPRAQLLEGLVRDFVHEALGGSLHPFMAYLSRRPERVSDADLEEMRQLVCALEEQRGGSGSSEGEGDTPQ